MAQYQGTATWFCCYPDVCGCDDCCCQGNNCSQGCGTSSYCGPGGCCTCNSNYWQYAWKSGCSFCCDPWGLPYKGCGQCVYVRNTGFWYYGFRSDTGPAYCNNLIDLTKSWFMNFAPLSQGTFWATVETTC